MGILDDIQDIAKGRESYVPNMPRFPPVTLPPREVTLPPRESYNRPVRPSNGQNGGSGSMSSREVQRYRDLAAQRLDRYSQAPPTVPEETGGEGSNPLSAVGGFVGNVLMGAVNLYDQGRQGYQGYAGEIGDAVQGWTENLPGVYKDLTQGAMNTVLLNPLQMRGLGDRDPETGERGPRDKSFDFDKIFAEGMDEGFLGRNDWDDSLPGIVRAPIGLLGDVLSDPGTYATLGIGTVASNTAKGIARAAGRESVKAAAKGPARAAAKVAAKEARREAARSALPSARKVLAIKAALKAGDADLVEAIGLETIDNVAKNFGKRGRGAATKAGMRRGGYTADDLAQMGMLDDFTYTFGVGQRRVKIPLTGRAAAASENLKGSIKAFTGNTAQAARLREMFNTGLEATYRTAILKGSPDAATAARGLAVLGRAKGDANRWAAETMNKAAVIVKNMDPDDAKAITRMLESGVFESSPRGATAQAVAEFLKKTGISLQDAGITLPFLRDGYAPHRATKQARLAARGGDERVAAALGINPGKQEAFQKARVKGGKTIDEINADWRASGYDFDLLESDIRKTLQQYIVEGQQAMLKNGLVGDEARRLGLVDDMGRVTQDSLVDKAIKEQTDANMAAMAKAARTRSEAFATGRRALVASRKAMAATVRAGDTEVTKAKKEVERLTSIHDTAQRKLVSLEAAADGLRVQLRKASKAEKTQLTNRLNTLDGRRPALKQNLQTARTRLTKRQGIYNELRSDAANARLELEAHDSIIRSLSEERAKMNSQAVNKNAVTAENRVLKAEAAVQKQREDFVNPKWDDVEAATQTKSWATADQNQLDQRISQSIGRIDDWMESVDALPGRGSSEGVRAYAAALTDQMRVLKKLLQENSSKSTFNDIIRLEAQALDADIAALTATRTRQGIEKAVTPDVNGQIKALTDPNFQKMVVDQMKEGFSRLAREGAGDAQINRFYSEAIGIVDDIDFGDLSKWMGRYMGAQNWWKGQALANPGFLVRNSMGGAYNMYLDNIPVRYAIRFSRYHNKISEEGWEAADAWAKKAFGPRAADKLNEAATVAAATGDGQAASEYAGKILGSANKKINVLSSQHALPARIRARSAKIESGLRGGHAYGVLEQGGDYAEALARVEKFHFNYNDLGKFDQAAKLVSPFWVFFSRNMALQTQVYAKNPGKLSRSYYNYKRNIEDGFGFDEDTEFTPWHLGRGGVNGIRTGLNVLGDNIGPMSLTPDIPSVRFPGQMANLAESKGLDLAGQLPPWLKIPVQAFTNTDQFRGNQYNNSLEEYRPSLGRMAARSAPGWIDQPGLRNILDFLPGTEIRDGKLLMQDNTEAQLMQAHPYLQRLVSMSGGGSSDPASGVNAASSFLGGLVRFNSPQGQDSGRYFENKIPLDAAKAVQEEIRLRNLVSMDARD